MKDLAIMIDQTLRTEKVYTPRKVFTDINYFIEYLNRLNDLYHVKTCYITGEECTFISWEVLGEYVLKNDPMKQVYVSLVYKGDTEHMGMIRVHVLELNNVNL